MSLSSGIAINSVVRVNNVVTVVTVTPHGFNVNQGISIQGTTQDFNSVVTSVVNSTTFTCNQNGSNFSLGNGGNVYPAKQVIILETRPGDNNIVNYSVCLWLTTQYPTNGVGGSNWNGASPQEVAALQSGKFIEKVVTVQVPGSLTVAQTKVLLQAVWTGQQNYLASLTPQPAQYYGFVWDGIGWSV